MFKDGVIVGKFLPYHLGHHYLITEAAKQCEHLTVYVCRQQETEWFAKSDLRANWIWKATRHIKTPISIVVLEQNRLKSKTGGPLTDEDSEGWAYATITQFHGHTPDVVFTSENYGDTWSHYLKCAHVKVDLDRTTYPISGTAIRLDPINHLHWMLPHVRQHFCKRVLIVGAESTGKSTLSADLAAALDTIWVPEFGRIYTEIMPEPTKHQWTVEDFLRIADTQDFYEDEYAGFANRVLICDTNSWVTEVFMREYMGYESSHLSGMVRLREEQHPYDLFIVTDIETPFEQDATGTREDGARRHRMHNEYLGELRARGRNYIYVSGTREERLEQAVAAVQELTPAPAMV